MKPRSMSLRKGGSEQIRLFEYLSMSQYVCNFVGLT